MRVVSLFTGIGGIDLGLERAGMTTVAQVENDPWCTQILEKHWPTVPRWGDIHDVDPKELPDHDIIAGGFPCQPVSVAGARLAQDDPRWLWPEFARIVRVVRPRYVLVENVPGFASAGMGDVLGDLAEIGYDMEWTSIPAAAVGAPHLRWRFFIVAYPHRGEDRGLHRGRQDKDPAAEPAGDRQAMADTNSVAGSQASTRDWRPSPVFEPGAFERVIGRGGAVAHSDYPRSEPGRTELAGGTIARGPGPGWGEWAIEPDVGRVADGVPRRVDRLRGLGNAVVPQVAEFIGRLIMEDATR